MSNQVNSLKKGLTVKDLVTTGIFSAIFFVFTLVGGLPFAPNPVLTFYMPMGAALLCGPIYLLMVAKVQKRWSVTILGIIMGIIWFATGMHWAFSLGYIGMGLIADLVAGAGHYRNKAINLLSYMLISLGGIYTYVVFFLDPDGWASTMLNNGTEQSYIDTMNASAPSWLLVVIIAGTLTVAALSGWVGGKMLKSSLKRLGSPHDGRSVIPARAVAGPQDEDIAAAVLHPFRYDGPVPILRTGPCGADRAARRLLREVEICLEGCTVLCADCPAHPLDHGHHDGHLAHHVYRLFGAVP